MDEDSDVLDVLHVSQRSSRRRRRVSSDSDVPLVRGSSFSVLTESDDESDPLIRPTGQTRNEDDVFTVPASSGAVAAHVGAISGMRAGGVRHDIDGRRHGDFVDPQCRPD